MDRFARVIGKPEAKAGNRWVVPAVVTAVLIIIVGLLVWYFSRDTSLRWQKHLRTDADYSVEMPGTVQAKVQQDQTEYGPTTVQTLQCQTSKPPAMFTVQYSPFPTNSPFLTMTPAQADTMSTKFVKLLAEQLDGKLLDQKAAQHAAGRGRSFRIQLSGKRQYHGRTWYLGPGQYQLSVIAPEEAEVPDYVPRFLNSFEYRGK